MTTSPQPAPSGARRRPRRVLLLGAAVLSVGCLAYVALDRPGDAESVRTASVAGVREIVVEVDAGPITLAGTPGTTVDIRTTLHGSATGTPRADHQLVDGVLTVRASCAGMPLGCHVDEELTVPAGIPVRAETAAGTIEASRLDVPRLDVTTSAGSVSAGFSTAPQDVRVRTATGNVDLQLPDAGYRIDAGTALGERRVAVRHDPASPRSVVVETAAGAVTVRPAS